MKYFENDDVQIPALGFGTWKLKGEDCVEGVQDALEIGYRHIDTAQIYENEEKVGLGIKRSEVDRDDVFLTTKIWRTNLVFEDVLKTFEKSLDKLKMNYVDLLLIHWPNKKVPVEETIKAMEKLRSEDKVKNIGVSNFTVDLLERATEASEAPIICDQVEYHPFLSQEKILNHCKKNNIALTSYSPLSRGKVLDNKVLKEIGKKYNKTPAQVTLRWHMQQENVIAIPKTSTPKYRKENFNIFDFELTEEEMKKIFNLANDQRAIDPGFAPDWD